MCSVRDKFGPHQAQILQSTLFSDFYVVDTDLIYVVRDLRERLHFSSYSLHWKLRLIFQKLCQGPWARGPVGRYVPQARARNIPPRAAPRPLLPRACAVQVPAAALRR